MSPYSPERRTALVLCGTGAHGAYHAGVLRALERHTGVVVHGQRERVITEHVRIAAARERLDVGDTGVGARHERLQEGGERHRPEGAVRVGGRADELALAFQSLDVGGVGKLVEMACRLGRGAKPRVVDPAPPPRADGRRSRGRAD